MSNRFWQVSATINLRPTGGDWETHREVPTFILDANIQGIRNRDDAVRVARSVILPTLPASGWDVTVHPTVEPVANVFTF